MLVLEIGPWYLGQGNLLQMAKWCPFADLQAHCILEILNYGTEKPLSVTYVPMHTLY